MSVLPCSVHIQDSQVFLGQESGQIAVFLHLGKGHLVKKQVIFNLKLQVASVNFKQVISGHSSKVSSIDADEKFMLSGSSDHTAKFWSCMDGTLIRTLQGHESQVKIPQLGKTFL